MIKQNKQHLPKLRFPEFDTEGGWEVKTLGEILVSESSQLALNKIEFASKGNPIYGADGLIGFANFFIQQNDYIAIVKDGSGVGKLFLYKAQSSILSTLCYLILKDSSHYNLAWAFYSLNTLNFDSYVKGSGIPHIYYSDYKKVKIKIPSLAEQEKIASCLSSLDEWIAAQSDKVATLKTYKKGLMQQLFPAQGETLPKLRFKEFHDCGEWEVKTLGDEKICSFINEKIHLSKLKLETYISTENILPNYSGLAIASKLPPSGSFTKFKKGDILISNIRPYLKKVWVATFEGAASNDIIIIRANDLVIESFLSFMLKNDVFINYIMKSAKGVKMPRGDKEAMEEYLVYYPKNKAEQEKIASCLSAIDERIAAESEKLTALKNHKKGLMQQLFPK